MKKLSLLFVILAVLCFAGCDTQQQQSSVPTPTVEQTQPTVQTTVPEPTQCKHEVLLEEFVIFEFGREYASCEDPSRIYHKCRDCGEFVHVADEPSQDQCYENSSGKTVTKEATCTEDGIYTIVCRRCNQVRERAIPSKGHTYCSFWGEDVPKCLDCGIVQTDACSHEYELSFSTEPNGHFPGKRNYQCKHCEKMKVECFDKHGDYDFQTVKDALCAKLQAAGFLVLEDYDLSSNDHVYEKHDMLYCKETNSKKAPQQLTEMGSDVIDQLMSWYNFGSAGVNPADYYVWVSVTYVSSDIASGFVVTVYARATFWKI